MSRPIKVKWFEKKQNSKKLNEIYQQTGLFFSFVTSLKKGSLQCHEWVKCRDFLHDAARCSIQTDSKMSCDIYGFRFDPSYNPVVDMTKIRMLVTKEQSTDESIVTFKRKIKCAVRLLHYFETLANVGKTRVKTVKADGNLKYKSVFLFTGPVMWMSSPYLVSMYTFLIRLGDKELRFKDGNTLRNELHSLSKNHYRKCDNDSKYLEFLWNKLDLIIKKRNTLFSKDKKNSFYCNGKSTVSVDLFHNCSGIYSLARACTADCALNATIKVLVEEQLRNGKKETDSN